jgi:hypothetical protein
LACIWSVHNSESLLYYIKICFCIKKNEQGLNITWVSGIRKASIIALKLINDSILSFGSSKANWNIVFSQDSVQSFDFYTNQIN